MYKCICRIYSQKVELLGQRLYTFTIWINIAKLSQYVQRHTNSYSLPRNEECLLSYGHTKVGCPTAFFYRSFWYHLKLPTVGQKVCPQLWEAKEKAPKVKKQNSFNNLNLNTRCRKGVINHPFKWSPLHCLIDVNCIFIPPKCLTFTPSKE